jgi:outer membrane protein TolC
LEFGASEADLSNPAESYSSSFQVGAFLKWNLFNGLSDNTLLEKAKIQERMATLKLEKLRLSLRTQMADAIDNIYEL